MMDRRNAWTLAGGIVGILALLTLGRGGGRDASAPARLSGNCGPAAQGLTPDGDVVPIKVDRAGRVLLSAVGRGAADQGK
jgi:hypothetical protein